MVTTASGHIWGPAEVGDHGGLLSRLCGSLRPAAASGVEGTVCPFFILISPPGKKMPHAHQITGVVTEDFLPPAACASFVPLDLFGAGGEQC